MAGFIRMLEVIEENNVNDFKVSLEVGASAMQRAHLIVEVQYGFAVTPNSKPKFTAVVIGRSKN